MSNLSLFKPCVDWCVQSHMSFHYSGMWILAIALISLVIGYVLLKSDKLEEDKEWIPELLILFCMALLIGFFCFNYYTANEQKEENINSNIEFFVDKLPDSAPMLSKDERTDTEYTELMESIKLNNS